MWNMEKLNRGVLDLWKLFLKGQKKVVSRCVV